MDHCCNIGETIKTLRRQRGISQEVLAQALAVSIQAVSKWETGVSLPDILLLPAISRFFGVSIDALFCGPTQSPLDLPPDIPDDSTLRIIQCRGRTWLRSDTYDPNVFIPLDATVLPPDLQWNAQIWGSAHIQGDVGGCVDAGNSINCGNVGGNVDAGNGVSCGNVGGYVNAGNGVSCGNIGGNADAGNSVSCGNISGSVDAGDRVHCGNIGGDVNAGNEIHCGDISGSVHSEHSISCGSINGSTIECETLVCKEGHICCDAIHCESMREPSEQD